MRSRWALLLSDKLLVVTADTPAAEVKLVRNWAGGSVRLASSKVKVDNPVVDLDGDEMTRYASQLAYVSLQALYARFLMLLSSCIHTDLPAG